MPSLTYRSLSVDILQCLQRGSLSIRPQPGQQMLCLYNLQRRRLPFVTDHLQMEAMSEGAKVRAMTHRPPLPPSPAAMPMLIVRFDLAMLP